MPLPVQGAPALWQGTVRSLRWQWSRASLRLGMRLGTKHPTVTKRRLLAQRFVAGSRSGLYACAILSVDHPGKLSTVLSQKGY